MSNVVKKAVVRNAPRVSKPRPEIDKKALREEINENFSETLAYLGR